MSSHHHCATASSQNQGNTLGSRSCIRQSRLFRQYESGNDIKNIMGMSNLTWKTHESEGVYRNKPVYDANKPMHNEGKPVYDANKQNRTVQSALNVSSNGHTRGVEHAHYSPDKHNPTSNSGKQSYSAVISGSRIHNKHQTSYNIITGK